MKEKRYVHFIPTGDIDILGNS